MVHIVLHEAGVPWLAGERQTQRNALGAGYRDLRKEYRNGQSRSEYRSHENRNSASGIMANREGASAIVDQWQP